MRNPFTAIYDWALLNYCRVLIAASTFEDWPDADECDGMAWSMYPPGQWTDEERAKADLGALARADFIVHGGDVEFIERVEATLGVEWGDVR